jgi:hypothetical protein
MPSRFGRVPRLCIILWLILAVSPLTAPFSTCDLGVLFHDAPSPAAATLQAKVQGDEPVAGTGEHPCFQHRGELTPRHVACACVPLQARKVSHLPLRI